jgi:hypothetical protein
MLMNMAKPNLTLAGFPVQRWITTQREAEAVAAEVIEGAQGVNERKPGDVWAVLALLLVHWHAAHHRALSPKAVEALGAALAPALESPEVKTRLGLPMSVKAREMDQLMLAAQLDGEADAAGGAKLHREALAAALLVVGRTIDAWRKQPDYIERREFVRGTVGKVEPAVPRGIDPQKVWIRERDQRRARQGDVLRRRIALKARGKG